MLAKSLPTEQAASLESKGVWSKQSDKHYEQSEHSGQTMNRVNVAHQKLRGHCSLQPILWELLEL